ncbi:MAG TPA: acyl-ACP thioesterase domain-containing protein [Acidimicrobiales bacterium]|nr:acyl-ACP thioesterase domain-containing protein [Acidimicrobiales bacterium]
MPEFLPPPSVGRRFAGGQRVRLGDTDPEGRLRPDAAARYLHDVAGDDWDETGITTGGLWVVRRTAMRLTAEGRWPNLGEAVTATTWCSGIGAAWAERRTDLAVGGVVLVETEGLWVPLEGSGRPRRIPPEFRAAYGEASTGRKAPGRVAVPAVASDAERRPWPLRRVDLDVAGHVNNAASWTALVEVAAGPVAAAVLTHHRPLEWGAPVTLATAQGRVWLLNGDDIRVAGEFIPLV